SEEYFRLHSDAAAIDLMPDSAEQNILKSNKDAFPDHIDVMNVGSTGELIAGPDSVYSLQDIDSEAKLTEVMIDNEKLGHSALHENEHVDKLVHDFLNEK